MDQEDFKKLNSQEILSRITDLSEELLATRRSGHVHDQEEAKILIEDVAGLVAGIEAFQHDLFEEIFQEDLQFHLSQVNGTTTFNNICKVLIKYSAGIEQLRSSFTRFLLDGNEEILEPLPLSMDLQSARKLHGDLPEFQDLDKLIQKVSDFIEIMDSLASGMTDILASEHLQRYWLERLGYMEIETVIRWIEGSLCNELYFDSGDSIEDPPYISEYPHIQYLPGSLIIDEEGSLLAIYRIYQDQGYPGVDRTILLTRFESGSRYPWNLTPPELLLGKIRMQQDLLKDRVSQDDFFKKTFDEDDILEL